MKDSSSSICCFFFERLLVFSSSSSFLALLRTCMPTMCRLRKRTHPSPCEGIWICEELELLRRWRALSCFFLTTFSFSAKVFLREVSVLGLWYANPARTDSASAWRRKTASRALRIAAASRATAIQIAGAESEGMSGWLTLGFVIANFITHCTQWAGCVPVHMYNRCGLI